MSTLSVEENLAITNILGCFVIAITLFSIINIFFGNEIIKSLKLDERFPKIKKFIELRLKFQRYYLFINTLIIIGLIAVCLAGIY
jgi:hypothetical protein